MAKEVTVSLFDKEDKTPNIIEHECEKILIKKLKSIKDYDEIDSIQHIISICYDEEYAFEYIKQMEEKYGKSSFEFEELDSLDENGDPYYTMVEKWEEDYTESDIKLIDDEKNTLMWESRAKQARAHKILWRYIEHNIQSWWD